ncbi:hypothetical protein CFBP498_49830 (plasmid) [Xanthomonas hortorum pv. vitians]|uniref:Uncharacterized protein n=1 Tax=Xanthomonas hortorum pv. vitians TaxID=83224 RepID=A0A6V7FKU1_9XANT|nr:hypothetical protein CFBP498_49830 [Xanthomonas hortorum pv. vitians]CAD0363940.1 hypothetical protein CFBP498_49830 [Xanthomonas hortorum pv. vitians]
MISCLGLPRADVTALPVRPFGYLFSALPSPKLDRILRVMDLVWVK